VGERAARLVTDETTPFADMRVPQSCILYSHPLTCVLSWHNSRSTTHSLAPRFTEKWKARLRHPSVPPEALPPALKRKFDTANENKERYRRASSSLIRSPSLAVSDDDAGGRSTGASAKVVPK
jgi:hypothetical protein